MVKFFQFLFVCLFVVSFSSFAQNLSISNNTGHEEFNSTSRGAVLYDQTANPGTNGSPSQYFSDFTAAGESADDFTVPGGFTWNINEVFIVGTYNAGAGANYQDVSVYIYDNNAGVPGNLVYSALNVAVTFPASADFDVVLPTVASLPAGTYWLSVIINMAFNPGGSQFFWSQGTVQHGSFHCFRDQQNLFGTGLFANWASTQGTGIGGGVEPDLLFTVYGEAVVPVELTSFSASVINGKVNLNWSTATETNNYGFDVERKVTGQEFAKVGFVAGFGTTTEARNYNFVDNSVTSGNYTYRLKQVDLDGTSEYSNEVEVSLAPSSYSLDQNYPNPFNPSTKINFSLASDSKVTLKIFDVLGQEVTTLINGSLSAGIHNLNFDASGINSGVYFYTIEATGVDGTNFQSTKKMMLTK